MKYEGMNMKYDLGKTMEEAVAAYFNLLSPHFPKKRRATIFTLEPHAAVSK
jgi:hypothetical protein